MSVAETTSVETAPSTASPLGRPWSPTDRDRLIYRWVKFDGHKQTWVADQLSLNQSTVSRIVDRYERWIARGGLTQQGSPSRDERLRAQRWLTYERNEWILASCMRLAGEMERSMDTSKSTILHHAIDPSRELEVRTEHKTLERSGTACRFLRLAHRVNMDQEKLLEKIELPALEPLTLDPNEYSDATADAREGFQQGTPFERNPSGAGFQPADSVSPETAAPETRARRASEGNPPSTPVASPLPATLELRTPSPEPPSSYPVHNPTTYALPLTPNTPTTSAEMHPSQNKNPPAYAVALQPPEPTNPLAEILSATLHQPLPPIKILPVVTPMFG